MADPDMIYLSTSANIIETNMESVRVTLAEGSRCILPCSKRGECQTALQLATVARDRLNSLIAELEPKP
jgi:hypothetical protein